MPAAAELLDVWDRAAALGPTDRALALLARARSETEPDSADLSVGTCNRRLLQLRDQFFGPRVAAADVCPGCSAQLDVSFTTDALTGDHEENLPNELAIDIDDYHIAYRPLTSRDLALAAHSTDLQAARLTLLERCVVAADKAGTPVRASDLPAATIQAVADAVDQADPCASINLALECDACGSAWTRPLEIAGFLWREIDGWARRTLQEVHVLASAYGWSESTVLSLSSQRRRLYLEMIVNG